MLCQLLSVCFKCCPPETWTGFQTFQSPDVRCVREVKTTNRLLAGSMSCLPSITLGMLNRKIYEELVEPTSNTKD